MLGPRLHVNLMEMMRDGAFVEFDADERFKPFAVPPFADGTRRGQAGRVVGMNGDLNDRRLVPLGEPRKDGVNASARHALLSVLLTHPIPQIEVRMRGLQFVTEADQAGKFTRR